MTFNDHSRLAGQHAFLGASKYHWINYDEAKVADTFIKAQAVARGTTLHEFAAQCIRLGQKLPRSHQTLNSYVNDAVGFKMTPEQVAQLGAGPEDGLYITGNDVTWKQLIGENSLLSLVKTYVCQKVRLIFDPPLTSSVLDAMERSLKEMEWRILAVTDISADSGDVTECVDREARAEIAEHAVLEVNNG